MAAEVDLTATSAPRLLREARYFGVQSLVLRLDPAAAADDQLGLPNVSRAAHGRIACVLRKPLRQLGSACVHVRARTPAATGSRLWCA